jgi:uncharacterized membrane protein
MSRNIKIVFLITFLLSLFGLGVSIYLTLTHFFSSSIPLACSDTGLINCAKVTTSPQSKLLGIPVAVLGLVFYIPMCYLCFPKTWTSRSKNIAVVRQIYSVMGILFVIYLISMELLVIKNICLWCTSVHIATFILFILITASWNYTGWNLTTVSKNQKPQRIA